ncbi:helix-turn-helix transcriptional regulator [Aquincola sp. S2]|uniref:Helix-turn-helix transcriptional regulator n=1 Tax=Pseudaquabacterium terrae TaxID=2732868 RepID=A0ABX2EKR7_9BURK|nr:helix-turn-helix transcriptional regulator [Aquabacterium terrae]NRF69244.1 helix-turn-helix transcriptional regulator [Aquabacterium terrae]
MLDAFDLPNLTSLPRSSALAFDQATPPARRLLQMVDELDYGIVLLNDEGLVCQANRAARRELDAQHPLLLIGNELRARHPHDLLSLRDALTGAAQRGLRRLLCLGSDELRVTLAVVPLAALPGEAGRCVMLVLGKRQVCEELTVEWFARAHGLTLAETAVVKGLCADLTPHEIALRQGVGLATIRTQIGSVRAKTRSPSIRALVRQVAMLPPLVSALQGLAPLPAPRPLRPALDRPQREQRTALAA